MKSLAFFSFFIPIAFWSFSTEIQTREIIDYVFWWLVKNMQIWWLIEQENCFKKKELRSHPSLENIWYHSTKIRALFNFRLFCGPMDCRPPGSSAHGILQARTVQWAAIPFFKGPSPPKDRTWVPCTAGGFSTTWASREAPTDAGAGSSCSQRLGCQIKLLSLTRCPDSRFISGVI